MKPVLLRKYIAGVDGPVKQFFHENLSVFPDKLVVASGFVHHMGELKLILFTANQIVGGHWWLVLVLLEDFPAHPNQRRWLTGTVENLAFDVLVRTGGERAVDHPKSDIVLDSHTDVT